MPQSERVSLRFKFNWKISALTIFLLPVLVCLGFWQLQRAQEKRDLLAEYQQRWNVGPVDLDSIAELSLQNYRPVRLTGSFSQKKWFFLDNKIHGGRVGYEVLVPFYTVQGNWVLINRGWVPAPPRRDQLPEVRMPLGKITVSGRISLPTENIVLSDELVSGENWPKVIQTKDIQLINKLLGHTFVPALVHIDDADAAALAVDWKPVNISPAKHLGYAWQWFTMATVLAVLFFINSSNITEVLRCRLKTERKAV